MAETSTFEVMGEDGLPTGRLATPQEIRDEGLKVRYAQVYIFNSKGEMLVQQRTRHAKSRPNLLDPSAAGHVEIGDSFLQCAETELFEEVGIKTPLERAFAFTGYWGFCEVFKGVWDGELVAQAEEVENIAWLPLDVLDVIMKNTPWLASDGFVSSYSIYRGWRTSDER